ncbi:lipoprotein LpqB [Nocardia otitidiscaviarum]|uniref:Lipoprotein LpqB n=1 Tax=Nocardia otitidiscaviarum TaxID=1823 RepID=A0A378Y807_9NOCA|nr:MtrAB system accessory lipoprotein LpqB [Nocardia otitidiscaviarum]MBF6238573.1 MtrAB system accessory protein LpqB [Nocardia otitidiscaviarum]SUA72988.1 lipoprotein LpqB [Nocardia otitidiscaviarum]
MRLRRIGLLAVLVGSLSGMVGCAQLPDSSAPQALGTLDRQPTSTEPAPPIVGREPEALLQDFVQATADPANRHQAARQFLTPAAAVNWDDAEGTTIIEKPDTLRESRTEDTATYVIRTRKIGELEADGSYRVADGTLEDKVKLVKIDGEWRIDDLPTGVLIERSAFNKSYRRHALYFSNQAGTVMVPDLRWIAAPKEQLTQKLLGLLAEGPQPALTPAVKNVLSGPVSLRGPVTKANGEQEAVGVGAGGVLIDFSGAAGLDARAKDLLAAQVVLTLSEAEIFGPFMLLADGKPLDERYALNGWTRQDVEALSPSEAARNRIGLHAVRDGSLVRVTDNGIVPAPGFFGTTRTLQSVGLSPDGQLVAAVADSGRPEPEPGRTLIIGTYDGTGFPVATGGLITRPSWTSDGTSAWAVVDGERVIRAVHDRASGNVSVQDVDISALIAPVASATGALTPRLPITDLRISPSGVRAALIAGGKVYLAVVEPRPEGRYALTAPLPIAPELSTAAVSLDWYTQNTEMDSVMIAREGTVDPIVRVPIDGSGLNSVTSQNLTPPLRVVAAASDRQYVADARDVMELTSSAEGGERYWRVVPGLGANAIPVLPG